MKKLLVGIVMLIGIVGVMGVSGCGVDDSSENEVMEISAEQRTALNKLLDEKDYASLISETISIKDENPELLAMYYFASAMEAKRKGDMNTTYSYIREIPLEYEDFYAEIIKQDLLSQSRITEAKNSIDNFKDIPPAIGITKEQLKVSSWGLPTDINKTITENNVSEQWVYDDGKYVYLDNGIVTAIQK